MDLRDFFMDKKLAQDFLVKGNIIKCPNPTKQAVLAQVLLLLSPFLKYFKIK